MKNLTFAKVMIALCLIGSGVLAWYDWQNYQRIQFIQDMLRPNGMVETTVRETQKLGKEYDELQQALAGEGLLGQDTPLSYISALADQRMIDIGQVDIQASSATDKLNTVDQIFTVNPQHQLGHADARALLLHLEEEVGDVDQLVVPAAVLGIDREVH